jgi:hypothetical protein
MLEINGKYWLDVITYSRDHPEPHSPVPSLVSSPSPPPVNKHMTGNNKRRRGNLPKAVTAILRDWLCKHKKHPYPTEEEKAQLAAETNLNLNQISNWFINSRRRILQPMLEEEERKRNGLFPQEDDRPLFTTKRLLSDIQYPTVKRRRS